MQKMVDFYHIMEIDMLKLGCTLQKLANICHHKSTTAKFYSFTVSGKDLLEKLCEDMFVGPSFVLTKSCHGWEIFRGFDRLVQIHCLKGSSQLYLFSMCQAMPTGLYTKWELELESGKLKLRLNKTRSFEITVISYFQRFRSQCKVEGFNTMGTQKRSDAYSVDGFCGHRNTVFEAVGCSYCFCPCQEARTSLTEEEIQRGIKQRELDKLRKQYIQEKGYIIIEM